MKTRSLQVLLLCAIVTAALATQAFAQMSGTPNPQMKAVLDSLASLNVKPIDTLSPMEARKQPSAAEAVKALLASQGKSTAPEKVAKVENREIPGPAGPIKARVYWPAPAAGASGNLPPVVHYIHGGGWVIATLDTYDASARAIANAAKAVVVSTHYRQAPEHPFPAAHEDSLAAYRWIAKNAASLGGDPQRIAVVGESAGGNMAAHIALHASKDSSVPAPVHQVLIYPVADAVVNSPSEKANTQAKPLNSAGLEWFYKHTFDNPQERQDPRVAIVQANGLDKVASATVITAQIDPLRSEGERYAKMLDDAGVEVTLKNYDGVTHEFFGMGAVLPEAKDAVKLVGTQLGQAFSASRKTARVGVEDLSRAQE